MFNPIPVITIIFIIISLAFSIGFPLLLLMLWNKKTKAEFGPFFIGCGIFVGFALILEQIAKVIFTKIVGNGFFTNALLLAVFGGLFAGIFEESGRLLAMKVFLKKKLSKESAVMYGIGHGGCEAILLVGLTYISNLIIAIMINTGIMDAVVMQLPEDMIGTYVEQLNTGFAVAPALFLLAGIERVCAILLHICLSYLVFLSVKYKKFALWGLAVFLHFFVDAATVFIQTKTEIWVIEVFLLVFVAIFLYFVVKDYKGREEADAVVTNAQTDAQSIEQ